MFSSLFRDFMAFLSCDVRFDCGAGALRRMREVSHRISSASDGGKWRIADSILEMMSSTGVVGGVTAKFPPLDRRDVSASDNWRSVRLITVREESSVAAAVGGSVWQR